MQEHKQADKARSGAGHEGTRASLLDRVCLVCQAAFCMPVLWDMTPPLIVL